VRVCATNQTQSVKIVKTQQAAKSAHQYIGKMLNQDFFSAASANSWKIWEEKEFLLW
jgi:hypothetical protein